MVFREIVAGMGDFGIYSTIIPFILAFTLTYAILEKVKIFREQKINIVISFVFGFLTAASMNISLAMNSFLEKVGFSLIIVLGIILILGMFKVNFQEFKHGKYIGLVLFLAVLFFQFSSTSIAIGIQNLILNRYIIVTIAAILTIWWITGSPSELIPIKSKSSKQERTLETGAKELEEKYGLEHVGDVTGEQLYDDHGHPL